MLSSVSVPVLSVAITVTEPRASTALRRRTRAWRPAIRWTLDADDIPRDEIDRGALHEHAIARDPGVRGGQGLELAQRVVRANLLKGAEPGIEQDDRGDDEPLDRPPTPVHVGPDREIEGHGEQEDVDEGALELLDEAQPERRGGGLGQGVGAMLGEEARRLRPAEAEWGVRLRGWLVGRQARWRAHAPCHGTNGGMPTEGTGAAWRAGRRRGATALQRTPLHAGAPHWDLPARPGRRSRRRRPIDEGTAAGPRCRNTPWPLPARQRPSRIPHEASASSGWRLALRAPARERMIRA